jgi:hypothetical protein
LSSIHAIVVNDRVGRDDRIQAVLIFADGISVLVVQPNGIRMMTEHDIDPGHVSFAISPMTSERRMPGRVAAVEATLSRISSCTSRRHRSPPRRT